ncbi:MAG: HDIG domain-containing protein [Phycisphaerae bacterium]|nr:HDIG domain-containing protein [Phycisphaerae bacterium]
MWPFRRKQTRRIEAVRNRTEPRHRLYELRASGLLTAMVIGLAFVAAATGVLLIGGRGTTHQLGEQLNQPLIARVSFDVADPDRPDRLVHVNKGDPIANVGTIEETEMAAIHAESEEFIRTGGAGGLALHVAGLACIVLLITAGLGIYTSRYSRKIIRQPSNTIAFAALLLLAVLTARVAMLIAWQVEVQMFAAATAVVLVAMVLSILYGQRFALGTSWFTAILIVLACRQDYLFLLVLMAGAAAVSMTLSEIRTRSKLLFVGAITAAVMAVAAIGTDCIDGGLVATIAWRMISVASAGIAAALIMQGALPLIERIFGVATAMTLLEQSDVSRPLLRRLATEAPGTFNHSLLLGSMAEAAADAIGANGLLARVGAYYHDIGKINKPSYFVENQEGSLSRHAKLSPAMSLLIILGHVKDGLEMAHEYGLAKVIWPFIAEHHGTTLVEYFYHAATQKAADQEPPPEAQFRYPGPKPQSKETAILMLCDSVEGATRALEEPTPGRIEDLVHQIARKKLHDGQLDECTLTLRELHIVEQSLIKSLWGFYHGRIAYPSSPERETRTA